MTRLKVPPTTGQLRDSSWLEVGLHADNWRNVIDPQTPPESTDWLHVVFIRLPMHFLQLLTLSAGLWCYYGWFAVPLGMRPINFGTTLGAMMAFRLALGRRDYSTEILDAIENHYRMLRVRLWEIENRVIGADVPPPGWYAGRAGRSAWRLCVDATRRIAGLTLISVIAGWVIHLITAHGFL